MIKQIWQTSSTAMGKQLPNALRNSQLRSADQFILQGWRHIHKVGTVAGYTDNQIFIFHRLSFGGYQGILVHHIELHMPQFQIAPGTNKGKQTLRPLFSGYHTRRQLEIQQAGRPLLIAFIFLRSDWTAGLLSDHCFPYREKRWSLQTNIRPLFFRWGWPRLLSR